MVSVPKDLKVRASNEIKGRCDHEEEGHSDYVACDTSNRCETNCYWVLYSMRNMLHYTSKLLSSQYDDAYHSNRKLLSGNAGLDYKSSLFTIIMTRNTGLSSHCEQFLFHSNVHLTSKPIKVKFVS